MLKLDRNSSNYNKIIQSSYGRYLSEIGQIHAIYVTDNNGRAVFNHNMHIMMKIYGCEITICRYTIGKKSSYCAEFSWDIFSQYSSQYVYGTRMYRGVEEVIYRILELAYEADVNM